MTLRLVKSFIVLQLAAFSLLVAFNNTVDYETNFTFVVHVMSMDTTFAESELESRSVTSDWAHRLCYALIILTEYVTGLLCLFGALRLFSARRESAAVFNSKKSWSIGALVIGFSLWFFVFLVIAGEWFAMWQSADFNGQESAFRLAAIFILVLIFVSMPDRELEA